MDFTTARLGATQHQHRASGRVYPWPIKVSFSQQNLIAKLTIKHMRKNSWIWGKTTGNMSSTKGLLSLSSALPSRIWVLALDLDFGVPCQRQCLNPCMPCGSSWHPGSWACLLERHELILLSCPHNGILIAADQFASSYTEMALTDIQGAALHCQELQVQFPALQDPGCTFNQLLFPECYS